LLQLPSLQNSTIMYQQQQQYPQQQYQNNNYQQGNKRPRGPSKAANPNLVEGNPCPTGCGAIIGSKNSQNGKTYLKCPNSQCGEWGGGNQQQQQNNYNGPNQQPMIQNPPYPAQYAPQGVATFTNPQPQFQSTNTSQANQTSTPSGDLGILKEAINVLGNRLNDLNENFNTTLGILTNDLFRSNPDEEPGAIHQILGELRDLSSRFDQFQKDFGVSKESVVAHQSFLVSKKAPPAKKAEA
jgi:hypothetical protein